MDLDFPTNNDQTSPFNFLKHALDTKTAKVGVIGLGYVGLPLVSTLHSSGYFVLGYDNDAAKIRNLNAGISYIRHLQPQLELTLSKSSRFLATHRFSDLSACHVLVMCLPTPVGRHNEPDMSYVFSTTSQIVDILTPGKLIVLESTTYPGATDGDLIRVLSRSSLQIGRDYFVAFSPEREDPGNTKYKTQDIPKLVGGVSPKCGPLAVLLYQNGGFKSTILVKSSRVAECAKLLENTYRAVNIALVNELKQVFQTMNVNIWDVLDAAATKPFGFQRFDPGPGIGGHCIPVDPFYLTWKAKETGAPCSFIELAALVNAKMPGVVVQTVQAALNDERKSVNGSRILLLGIAYKPNVDDIREAPALIIWEKLLDLGSSVQYHDPFIPTVCDTRKHGRLSGKCSVDLEGAGNRYDAIILVTHHDCFTDYQFLSNTRIPIIDTRNKIPKHLGLKIYMA